MNALHVVSLEEMKGVLVVHPSISEFDNLIISLIGTAVDWVEKYTSYLLYEREITEVFKDFERIYLHPVTFPETEGVYFRTSKLSKQILLSGKESVELTFTGGFSDASEIPDALKTAVKRLVVFWSDQPETAGAEIPIDVQIIVNQFRRDATI
jgi:hypothetical protein